VQLPVEEYSGGMDITLYMTIIDEEEKKTHETHKSQDSEVLTNPSQEVSLDNKEKEL
jgi:hypothetical protein